MPFSCLSWHPQAHGITDTYTHKMYINRQGVLCDLCFVLGLSYALIFFPRSGHSGLPRLLWSAPLAPVDALIFKKNLMTYFGCYFSITVEKFGPSLFFSFCLNQKRFSKCIFK